MPVRSHSGSGIMHPLWNRWDFANTLPQAFSNDEARDIRSTVARMAAGIRAASNWSPAPRAVDRPAPRVVSHDTRPDKLANKCEPASG